VISKTEIEEIVAKIARIPARNVTSDDRNALKTLDRDLKNVVFGQDKAIDALVTAIRMARSGLGNPQKPIGNFLFSGPTGVGKTEVARQLAYCLGIELIRFDMSEYMERHAVSRMIGAPPGYIGFDQGGQLTEAITKHPYSVLLMDEIEKAHPGHLQHPAAGDGPRHAHRQQRAQGRFPQRHDHHDDQRRARRARQGYDRLHELQGERRRDGRDQAALHAGVQESAGRDDLVLAARPRGHSEGGRQVPARAREPAAREESRADIHAQAQGVSSPRRASTRRWARGRWPGSSRTRSGRPSPTSSSSAGSSGGGQATIDVDDDGKVRLVFEETKEPEPVA
jgi:hypothetical protein